MSFLLNSLNKLKKVTLSLFRNKFNIFYNTQSRMFDSIYHMTIHLV